MLSEVFIRKAARDAMMKYAAEHEGKIGAAKTDVIQIVMGYSGDINDVRQVMTECVSMIAPELI